MSPEARAAIKNTADRIPLYAYAKIASNAIDVVLDISTRHDALDLAVGENIRDATSWCEGLFVAGLVTKSIFDVACCALGWSWRAAERRASVVEIVVWLLISLYGIYSARTVDLIKIVGVGGLSYAVVRCLP
ncbi:hypothetical protein Q7P37_005658 [Cladosporium fusiforme]